MCFRFKTSLVKARERAALVRKVYYQCTIILAFLFCIVNGRLCSKKDDLTFTKGKAVADYIRIPMAVFRIVMNIELFPLKRKYSILISSTYLVPDYRTIILYPLTLHTDIAGKRMVSCEVYDNKGKTFVDPYLVDRTWSRDCSCLYNVENGETIQKTYRRMYSL